MIVLKADEEVWNVILLIPPRFIIYDDGKYVFLQCTPVAAPLNLALRESNNNHLDI